MNEIFYVLKVCVHVCVPSEPPPHPVRTVNAVVNGCCRLLLPANGPSQQACREPIRQPGSKKASHANNMWEAGENRASAEAGRGLRSWQLPGVPEVP